MKTLKQRLMIAVPVLLAGGATLVGGLLWAESPHTPHNLKLAVNEQPVKRDLRLSASFAPIVKKVTPSVVKVSTVLKPRLTAGEAGAGEVPPWMRRFFGDGSQWGLPDQPMPQPPQHGVGSGVIVTKDGYIVTNNHVVEGADEVSVALQDGREFTAKVVGRDPKTDVAVIKVVAVDLPAIDLANSDQVEVGDLVLAIGNPFGIGTTVTMGMVSAKGRAPLGLDYQDFIQTDAAINPGNSGGPLVDVEGRLIGINTAILSRSGGNQGIGFAIPANLAREVMVSLVNHGHVVRGFLGVTIQDMNPALAQEFKLSEKQGALVADVTPNSPGAKAGLANGDVIVKFNNKRVTDSRSLKLQVAETQPGGTVPVEIVRNGAARTLQVKLGELPGEHAVVKASHEVTESDDALQGVGVVDLDAATRRQLRVPPSLQGAVVASVEQNCAAGRAGLKPGDLILEINREKVAGASDAVRLTSQPKERVTLVRVWRQGHASYILVDEGEKKNS